MSSTTTNQSIKTAPEIKLKSFEQILDLSFKTWHVFAVDLKAHQFSTIKTYLWLNITFLVGAAGLLSLLVSEHCLTPCTVIGLVIFTTPSVYGLYLGITGLSESKLLKVYPIFPCNFKEKMSWAPQYANIDNKPLMLEGMINEYQDSIDAYRELVAIRAKLLSKQNLWIFIAMCSLGLGTLMCIFAIGGS